MLSLPQWRSPIRQKSSTPLFPGAWPSTPSTVNASSNHTYSDDLEALKTPDKTNRKESNVPLPHLDHVTDFHRRLSQSFAASSSAKHLSESGSQGLNVEIPQSPHMTGLSEYTDFSSVSPSESLPTPEQYCSTDFTFDHSGPVLQSANDVQRTNPRVSNSKLPVRHPSAASRKLEHLPPDSPLLRFATNTQGLKFSIPSSAASFATSSEQQSTPDDLSYTARSSLSRSQLSDLPQSFPMSGFARNFFPLADKDSSHGLLSPSTLNSSRALDNDSPVLPSDDARIGLTPASIYAGQRRMSNRLNPSSAELDAFGIAASNIMIGARSSANSIPTSFQSASALESVGDTAQGHVHRQSSVSLSLSLDLSSEHDSTHRANRFRQVCDSKLHLPKLRNYLGRLDPSEVAFSQQTGATRTTTEVIATHARTIQPPVHKPYKFLRFDKVKKFGGRIRKLFIRQTPLVSNAESEFGVKTHTAVTAVEYTSAHSISRNELQGLAFTGPRSTAQPAMSYAPNQDPRKKRRQSMPATATTMPNVPWYPRPLRPASFLSVGTRGTPSRHLAATTNVIQLSSSGSHSPDLAVDRKASYPEPRYSTEPIITNKQMPPQVIVPSGDTSARRTRTRTAPQTVQERRDVKDRRFSLSSALGEAIRTTVIPHPSLPQYAIPQVIRYQPPHRRHSHTRSASTSANDAWNAGKTEGDSIPKSENGFERELESTTSHLDGMGVDDVSSPVTSDSGRHFRGHSEIQVVHRSFRASEDYVATQEVFPYKRARSHTQSTVQEHEKPRQLSRPQDDNPMPSKRRSRGFSLSSAIHKRAMRARSFIAGRSNDTSPALPGHHLDLDASEPTTYVSGVSFDMLSSGDVQAGGGPTSSSLVSGHSDTLSGCADYEPDLVLDRMSFATTNIQSTPVSSMDLSFNTPSQVVNVPVHSIGIPISANASSSTFADEDVAIDTDEREEEREFMRTLGLEFDEIVRRARDQ